jgi:hypothetical protein
LGLCGSRCFLKIRPPGEAQNTKQINTDLLLGERRWDEGSTPSPTPCLLSGPVSNSLDDRKKKKSLEHKYGHFVKMEADKDVHVTFPSGNIQEKLSDEKGGPLGKD